MSDIRFNQWLHNSGTGGVSQVDGGHVGIGTTNPLIPVGSGNTAILNVGVVTANSFYGSGANLTSLPSQVTITNNGNDRIITGGSGTNLNGEANLQFDGTNLFMPNELRHLGDPDTKIGFDTDTIKFETAGDERLRITSAGDFGTNGVTPTTQAGRVFHLHAGSNQQRFHMTNNTTGVSATDGFEILIDTETNANCRIRNFEAGYMAFDTGGSNNEVMRLDSSGRVMIGTTTEGHAAGDNLTIYDSGNCGITIRSGTTNNGTIYFSDGTSGTAEYKGAVVYNHDENYLRCYTNGTERIRIDSSGNMSLGYAGSPATSNGNVTKTFGIRSTQNNVLIGETSATSEHTGFIFEARQTGRSGNARIAQINMGNDAGADGRIKFQTAPDGADVQNRLWISNNGIRSYATFVDTSYHANPDPFADGSGLVYYRMNYNFQDSGLYGFHGTGSQGSPNKEFNASPHFSLVNSSGEPCWDNPNEGAINIPNLKNSYPFSMAAWINVSFWPTSADNDLIMNLSIGNQRISLCICCFNTHVSDGADFYIMYGGKGHHYFRPSSKPTNTWIHVVYSVVGDDNTGHRVYQNGADLTTRGNRGGGHGGSAGWALGGNVGNSERFAMGRIGSIRFFNKALSASEANTLYQNDTFYT